MINSNDPEQIKDNFYKSVNMTPARIYQVSRKDVIE